MSNPSVVEIARARARAPRRRVKTHYGAKILALVVDLVARQSALVPHRGGWRDLQTNGHVAGILVIEARTHGLLTRGAAPAEPTGKARALAGLVAGGRGA